MSDLVTGGGLVTGINGLLGSSLVERLTGDKRRFVGADLGDCQNQALGSYDFASIDLTDHAKVTDLFDRTKPAWVIHGAAMTAVDLCETERARAWAVNVDATAHLATLCERANIRFLYVSTDYVFDGTQGNYSETSPLRPLGVYATTKAAGELAAQTLCKRTVIARTSVPYGPFTHVKKDFVRWLRDELGAGKQVRIVTDQISNVTYAPDLARMLMTLIDSGSTGVFHTTGATSLSRFAFAEKIAEHFHLDRLLIVPIETKDLKQASPRPLNGSLSMKKAHDSGLAPLSIDVALELLRSRVQATS